MYTDFDKKLELIVKKEKKYKKEAYEFLMQALSYTQNKLKRKGHVSATELLSGIKELALEQFGPMAGFVFKKWGVIRSDDFGQMVFNMIENGLLFKNEGDSKSDFKGIYNFQEIFDTKNYKFELK